MGNFNKKDLFKRIFMMMPSILLFISALNQLDLNYVNSAYFSFNFAHILIFYCSLRKNINIGYGLIFISGLINDVVVGIPLGLSSLIYLFICIFATYLKNITLRPNLIKDWFFFLGTILTVNSFGFIMLNYIFLYQIQYFDTLINIFFTFIFYIVFAYCFKFLEIKIIGKSNV